MAEFLTTTSDTSLFRGKQSKAVLARCRNVGMALSGSNSTGTVDRQYASHTPHLLSAVNYNTYSL